MPTTVSRPGDDAYILQAYVDDQTSAFFEKLDKQIADMDKGLDDALNVLENNTQSVGTQIGVVSGLVSSLTTKLLDMAAQGVRAFGEFLKSSIDLRARVDTLGISLHTVGVNAGYTVDQLDAFEESVKSKGITTQQARDSLIQMAQAELDLGKASDVARVAQDAAVNAGVTSAEAFDRITRAVVTLQPEILRNLNLNVNLQAEYEKYAVSVNKSADALSFNEKKQVALNAVLEAGTTIAGTYENAMGSVGKLLTSIPRYLEEVQYRLGGMFQPSYLMLVEKYKELLGEVLKFLTDNEEEFTTLGVIGAQVLGDLLDMLSKILEVGAKVPGMIMNISDAVIDMLGYTDEQFNTVNQNIGETFSKAYALAKATISGILALWVEGMKVLIANPIKAAFSKDFNLDDVIAQVKALDTGKVYSDAYNKSLAESAKLMDEVANATDKATGSADNYAKILANKLDDAIALTSAKLKQMKERLDEEAAERAIQVQRNQIEEELNLQWQREDQERNHQERINDILENAEENKAKLVKQAAEARVEIEEDYRKRLQQIQKDFDYDATELARKRDAIGLLALIRQNKRQLEKEKDAQEERRKKIDENYTKTIKQLDDNLQEQLKKAEEARVKELENYNRSLERQRTLKTLHNKWEQEDRIRAQNKALMDTIKFFMGLDGATTEGLSRLLADWGWYYGTLGAMIQQYNSMLGAPSGINTGASTDMIKSLERQYGKDLNGDGKIGQAGQVSQMLSPSHLGGLSPSALGNVSRVPAVGNGSNSPNVRVIRLEGDVSGLDPYIQRILVNSLLEIERNNA